MKAKRLVSLFYDHIAKASDLAPLSDDDHPAILFGTDQIKLNTRERAIWFERIGWVSCPGVVMRSPRPEWAGIMKDGDEWSVVLGSGNPYTNTENGLPVKNGRVIAVPSSLGGIDALSR